MALAGCRSASRHPPAPTLLRSFGIRDLAIVSFHVFGE